MLNSIPHVVWVFTLVVLLLLAYVFILIYTKQDNEALKGLLIAGAGALWGLAKNPTQPQRGDTNIAGDMNVEEKKP